MTAILRIGIQKKTMVIILPLYKIYGKTRLGVLLPELKKDIVELEKGQQPKRLKSYSSCPVRIG